MLKYSLEVELKGLTEGPGVYDMYIIRIEPTTMSTEDQTRRKRRKFKEGGLSFCDLFFPRKIGLGSCQLAPLNVFGCVGGAAISK